MRSNRFAFVVLFILLLAGAPAWAADFEAGVATVKITPTSPIRMAGYASRTTPSVGVIQDLWAKALALRDSQGQRVVIVTTDLIGLSGPVSAEVFERVKKQFGLDRTEVLLTCSHTHSGPVIRDNLDVMGPDNTAEKECQRVYTMHLIEKLAGVIGAALKDLSPAKLESGHGTVGFAMNRRQRSGESIQIGVNATGPVDHDVPVLKVTSPEGRLRAIFFGYACHNTTIGGSVADEFYQINGDYAGFASAALEEQYPGVAAMFTILCGADQNPEPRGALAMARTHGQALATEVSRVLGTKLRPVHPPLRTACKTIELAFAPHTRQVFEDELKKAQDLKTANKFLARRAKLMLAAYDRRQPIRQIAYPMQAIRLGRDFTILALGGEVVVDYALRCKKEYRGENLMVIGYANDVLAYIPSQRVLREGGYEANSSMIYYGLPGPFADDIEDRVWGGINQLLTRVGATPGLAP